jgi:hypothetical protein
MTITIIILCYIAIGGCFAFVWYKKEYDASENEESEDEEFDPILALAFLVPKWVLFWPLKLAKDYFFRFIQ